VLSQQVVPLVELDDPPPELTSVPPVTNISSSIDKTEDWFKENAFLDDFNCIKFFI
jgi:hypothetical protein